MRFLFAAVPVVMMVLLPGCALLAEDVPETSPVVSAPAPTVVPPPYAETELPTSRGPVLVLPSTGKPAAHLGAAAPAARTGNTGMTRPQEPAIKLAEQAPPPAAGPAQSARGVVKEQAPKTAPGPAWLKGCQHRQQQGDVIMCDADALLVQPSDKVMVYVRDAKLVRKASAGQSITLRESLPRLYRFFVLE